jgi:hypothetical protein
MGTCQLCGKLHKAPGGFIAKHGYTVDYGFFSGTCHGSDERPFEVAKDVAEASLAKAASRRDDLLAQADAVSMTGNDDGTVWYFVRKLDRYSRKSYRVWEKVRLSDNCRFYIDADGEQHQVGFYGDANEIVRQLQARYADHFRRIAHEADLYIEWQSARCAAWAPKDMIPVAR